MFSIVIFPIRILKIFFSSWFIFVALLSSIAAGTVLVYWYHDSIIDALNSVLQSITSWVTESLVSASVDSLLAASSWFEKNIFDLGMSVFSGFLRAIVDGSIYVLGKLLEMFGFGLVPVALWTTAFIFALIFRRAWLKQHNRSWIGSVFTVVASIAFLGIFKTDSGSSGFFVLGERVVSGGQVGLIIAGSSILFGSIRVLGILALAVVVLMPSLVRHVVNMFGIMAMIAYALGVMAAKTLSRRLVQLFRFGSEAQLGKVNRNNQANSSTVMHERVPVVTIEHADSVLSQEALDAKANPNKSWDKKNGSPRTNVVHGGPNDARDSTYVPEIKPVGQPTTSHQKSKFNRLWTTKVDLDSATESNSPLSNDNRHDWKRPELNILVDTPESGITQEEMDETAETIQSTLADYNVEVEVGQIKPGPVVTMYGLMPGWIRRDKQVKAIDKTGKPKLDAKGKILTTRVETKTRVKVDSIISREKDLSLALKTPSLRIETPVMGKSLVGIEVPNPTPSIVTLRGVMESSQFKNLCQKATLPVALGRASGGEAVVIDLAKMPHLLIAGATGSGKSVCLNTIISCLILENSPAELRLLLVDPKRVELTPYNGVPHLLTPVVVETDEVVSLLRGLINEMLGRYRLLEDAAVRNIAAYNRKKPGSMPCIVVVVDELADLMMSASFDVERSLCRLAQLGRATGIHLIVATQRPSVDVLTGLIKANFPSRISFGVTSQIDSRTILDSVGAEKLLGRGDMLYQAVDASRPERAQGVFISDGEIEDLVQFWREITWGYLPEIELKSVEGVDDDEITSGNVSEKDELIETAVQMAHQYKKLSTSLLQRKLRIGYPRAARLMDQLEDEGIVGPGDGSKSRDVIIGV